MGYPTNLLCKRNATSPRLLRVLSQSSLFVLFPNLTTFGDRWPPFTLFRPTKMKTHASSDFSHFFSTQLERRKMADTICLFSVPYTDLSRKHDHRFSPTAKLLSNRPFTTRTRVYTYVRRCEINFCIVIPHVRDCIYAHALNNVRSTYHGQKKNFLIILFS